MTKDYKRIRLPKGLVRAKIVSVPGKHIESADYDKILEKDFEAHRAEYREVIMYGVPVKVKVEPDEGQDFRFYTPKDKTTT